MQVKVLKDVNLRVNGQSVHCKVGDVLTMADNDAKMHAAAGYVEIVKGVAHEIPAVKIAERPTGNGVSKRSFKKE